MIFNEYRQNRVDEAGTRVGQEGLIPATPGRPESDSIRSHIWLPAARYQGRFITCTVLETEVE